MHLLTLVKIPPRIPDHYMQSPTKGSDLAGWTSPIQTGLAKLCWGKGNTEVDYTLVTTGRRRREK